MDSSDPRQEDSPLLFHNEAKTVFLIDIPHSIVLAQSSLPSKHAADQNGASTSAEKSVSSPDQAPAKRKYLLSAKPPDVPYPSCEPKKPEARDRVLETIPPTEQRFHSSFIQPLVETALQEIKTGYSLDQGKWCLPRYIKEAENHQYQQEGSKKRKADDNLRQDGYGCFRQWSTFPPLPWTPSALSSRSTPPLILSNTSTTKFGSLSDIRGVVKNPSPEPAILKIGPELRMFKTISSEYIVPPYSNFVRRTIPLTCMETLDIPIPGLPTNQKFNIIVADPPWHNKSVKRSGHYETNRYSDTEILAQRLKDILRIHTYSPPEQSPPEIPTPEAQTKSQDSIAAIWITNSPKTREVAYGAMLGAGFRICEEWVWIKTTVDGKPVVPVDGLWKKPYEILVIGRKEDASSQTPAVADDTSTEDGDILGVDPATISRRVIAAVPDLHSRKPNLKCLFEQLFFTAAPPLENAGCCQSYAALEVFARNLTAGWWACGDEVLKFNDTECWGECEVLKSDMGEPHGEEATSPIGEDSGMDI